MRRFVALLVVATLATAAMGLRAPDGASGPDFEGPQAPDLGASAGSAVWFCPWGETGSQATSTVQLMALASARAALTVPSPLPGEDPARRAVSIVDTGARTYRLADVVLQGPAPVSVEFEAGPATAAATVDGATSFAADRCVVATPPQWWLVGGTTRAGREFSMRLFNPYPDTAFVSVTAVSEFGSFELPDLDALPVGGRSWIDVDLTDLAGRLDNLVLKIVATEGNVIPSGLLTADGGAAVWPAAGTSRQWFFPVASHEDLTSEVVIAAAGDVPVAVTIEILTAEGISPDVRTFVVDPLTPRRESLTNFASEAIGIVVRADGDVAAAVVAESLTEISALDAEDGSTDLSIDAIQGPLAAVSGAQDEASTWILPGPASEVGGLSTIWVMNSGELAATVLLTPMGIRTGDQRKILVQPGTVQRVATRYDSSVAGWLIESTQLITVGWSQETEDGVAFIAGVAVDG
jgi:Family of unknown function (DUF5719)